MITIKRYTANWCQPCKRLAPIFDELKREFPQIQFITIDVDQNKNQSLKDNVHSIPTVIIEKDNQIIERFSGVLPKIAIISKINKLL